MRISQIGLTQYVFKHDKDIVDANMYQGGVNKELSRLLKNKFDLEVDIPYDYFQAMYDSTEQTVWMRRETDFISSNIFVHQYPYTSEAQLTRDTLSRLKDEL